MDVTVERTDDVRRRVNLVVPAAEVSKVYKQVLAKVGGRARIKGFRPGKAPRKLLERRFGPAIREEVLERVLQKSIPEALDDQKLEPMGRPELDEVGELRDGETLTVSFSVEVLPELELTGWQGAELTVAPCVADDEDLQGELDKIADQHGSVDDVEGDSVDGDQITVSYKLGDEGEASERKLVVGGQGQEEWVAKALTGVAVGATFEVPEYEKVDENDARPEPQVVSGSVLGLKRRSVPAIDDALAKLDGRFETIDELKAHLTEDQKKRADRRTEAWQRDATLDHVLLHNRFDVPAVLVEREVDHRLSQTFGPQALQRGSQLASLLGEIRGSMRAEAKDQVRRALVVRHAIETHKIEIADEEIDAHIEKVIGEMKDLTEAQITQLKGPDGRRQSSEMLQQERALEALVGQVKITAGEPLHLRDPAPEGLKPEAEPTEDQAHEHEHVHGPDCDHDH